MQIDLFKPKIRVEILKETGMKVKKCVVDYQRIIIRHGRRGAGGQEYAPHFTKGSLIPYETGFGPFKRLHYKLMIFDGAEDCIDFDVENKTVIPATWDRHTFEKAARAGALHAEGEIILKGQNTGLTYVLLFLCAGNFFIVLLLARAIGVF
jgi:hypothetical protein